jgi:prolipoprotein diacylglyceryl transferase
MDVNYLTWNADPVLWDLGFLKIHWYGVMFCAAILSGQHVMKWIYTKEKQDVASLDALLGYSMVGIIVGARIAHCLFYEPEFYLSNPIKILAVWEGGLASHGGGLGMIIAGYVYQKKYLVDFIWLLDRLAIATALFGVFVRSANFINSEIVGIETKVPWAVIFERLGNTPLHPAQLYEAFAYLCIFMVLVAVYVKTHLKNKSGALFGIFLCLVFVSRFFIEYVKTPQAAYTNEIMSTGQWLSIPFFLVGVFLVVRATKEF